MFNKSKSNYFFAFLLLAVFSIAFYACEKSEPVAPDTSKVEQTMFQEYLADNTQRIQATDAGEGTYKVTGKSGTVIEVNNALVNSAGERVRGNIEIELIEIYTAADMILNRKQTLADEDGQLIILESGGEVFVQAYQNGEKLSLDGTGSFQVLLPTANTGGPKAGMEVFLGEETGEQVIWKSTGEEIRLVYPENRNGEPWYLIQDVMGWLNVDFFGELEGEIVDCISVELECLPCDPVSVVVGMYIPQVGGALEIPAQSLHHYEICAGFPLGGLDVTFFIIIECEDGTIMTVFRTVTVQPGNHVEVVHCDDYKPMSMGELHQTLVNITQ